MSLRKVFVKIKILFRIRIMILLWILIPDLHFIHRRHPPNFVWICNSFESYCVHIESPRTYRHTVRQTYIFLCLFCLLRLKKREHSSKGENFIFTHAITVLSFSTCSVCDEKVKKTVQNIINHEILSLASPLVWVRSNEQHQTEDFIFFV